MYISKKDIYNLFSFCILNESIINNDNYGNIKDRQDIRKIINDSLKNGYEIGYDRNEDLYYIHPALF